MLSAWLAVTFLTEVPTQRYPKLDKYQRQSEQERLPADPHMVSTAEAEVFPVSISQ